MNLPQLTTPTPENLHTDPITGAEIKRIIGLEVVHPMCPYHLKGNELTEEFNRMHVQAQAFNDGFRLSPIQCDAVAAYEIHHGLFGPIGVGAGKTLISLMCASAAYARGLTKLLLFVPPEVHGQLVDHDIGWARSRVHINFPIHILGGKGMAYRQALCKSDRKGLYVMPYSLLSTKDTSENLQAISPQLIIMDEAHRLANHSAARTRRVMSIIKQLNDKGKPPDLVILSGTITSKSIQDYYHLIKPCLQDNSPLPRSESMTRDWAALIDAQAASEGGAPPTPFGAAPIVPIVQWAEKRFPNEAGGWSRDIFGFRKAFRLRLNTAPGVISSGDTEIGTSLIIQNRAAPDHEKHADWPKIDELIKKVNDMWLTPNGDEIDFAIHKWKWLNELSCGFYNELTWPATDVYAKRKNITEVQAKEDLDHARAHHLAGQEYAKELREWLLHKSKPGIDTPFLCGQDMVRNGNKNVGSKLYSLWSEWKGLDFEGRPDRDSRGVRVCGFKIEQAALWAVELVHAQKAGGIIWYHHQEVGYWMAEKLHEMGLKQPHQVLHATSGEASNRAILNPDNKNKIVVASIGAHGTGKNLQHFQHMFILQWPRPAKDAEQLLGRLHRKGQLADELVVHTNHTLLFDHLNMAACLNDSLYIHQTTGNKQKLIFASYDPVPKIFPSAVLYERGLEASKLDREQERILTEKFGGYANV